MPTPLRLDGLLAKVETTYGTDAAPTAAADGVRVSQRVWSSLTPSFAFLNERDDVATGTLLPAPPAARKGRIATLDIAIELRGAGAAYSASTLPEADPLLRACGLSRTDDFTAGSESVAYSQADTSLESCTIYAYAGGKLFKLVGCRGSVRWPLEAGVNGTIRFTMQGMISASTTEASLPAITYNATLPPQATGLSLTVGTWSPDVVTAEFDQGAEVVQLPSANATDGIQGFFISRALPVFTLSAKEVPLSTYDPEADATAATARAINATLGATQYNRIKLSLPNAYVNYPALADQDGFAGYDLEYRATGFTITYD